MKRRLVITEKDIDAGEGAAAFTCAAALAARRHFPKAEATACDVQRIEIFYKRNEHDGFDRADLWAWLPERGRAWVRQFDKYKRGLAPKPRPTHFDLEFARRS